jgi:hypothetical protein
VRGAGFPLTTVGLRDGVGSALVALPTAAGVAQVLGPEGRVLITGRAASVRRWAASRLGAGRPPRKGARPSTDLSPVATAIRFALTTSAFHQRLAFERLMAVEVPLSARRDLKAPGYLHLDPAERFPRLSVRTAGPGGQAGLFGPFRDKAAAARARDALHKRFPLRPCDYVFEPDPALPLGLGCLYAQVRTCAAPCLGRLSEQDYRGLALGVAGFLAERAPGAEPSLPDWVTGAETSRGLVVEAGRAGFELYPVWKGAVLEDEAVTLTAEEDIGAAVDLLAWVDPAPPRDDTPWLSAWLNAPRRTGHYLVVRGIASLPDRIRELAPSS